MAWDEWLIGWNRQTVDDVIYPTEEAAQQRLDEMIAAATPEEVKAARPEVFMCTHVKGHRAPR